MKTRRIVNFDRPRQAPKGWEIYNAPRPLFGTKTWQGDFIGGVFYVAIDPEDPEADRWQQENERLAAVRLEFVSREQVVEEMVQYYRDKYPKQYVDKIFEDHPLEEKETQDMLIQTWFNLEMNWVD